MTRQREAAKLRELATRLLQSGDFGGPTLKKTGKVAMAIPILDPEKTLYAWYIPVTIGERIAGFFVFLPDSTLLQYSSFQHHEGHPEECPSADTWIDTKTILKRVRREMLAGERTLELYLSYDGVPSRIAWVVVTELPGGDIRRRYVAGNSVWNDLN